MLSHTFLDPQARFTAAVTACRLVPEASADDPLGPGCPSAHGYGDMPEGAGLPAHQTGR